MAENEQQLSTATNTTTEEGSSNDRPVQAAAENSPNVSPKRKPHRARDNGGVSADTKHIKKKWRSKLMNSLRKKVKRGSKVASSGSFDAEATDFSFHPQTRGSPSVGGKKRGSPSSKRGSQGSLSIETVKTAISEDVDSLPYEIRGGTPLHFYVWADLLKKEKTDFLVTLLTTGEVDVDSKSDDGNTPLHLAVKKGDVDAVKVLIAFGANVNSVNNRDNTPLDIATTGYVNQERKLTLANATLNSRLRQKSRESSPNTSRFDLSHNPQHNNSPLIISKIVPTRPKFVDSHLDGDYDGWISVDFTDGPPIVKKSLPRMTETRIRDLTDPVNITHDDIEQHNVTTTSSQMKKAPSPKNRMQIVRTTDIEEDEKLRQSFDSILNLLHATGGMTWQKLKHVTMKPLSLSGQHAAPDLSMELQRSIQLADYERGTTILSLYETLEDNINSKMEELAIADLDEAIALTLQQKEMKHYNKTLQVNETDVDDVGGRAGSRILCLDGGGIRGLIQVEILSQIERVTGRRIVNLFDWIIGTSTGGLIALGLTYGDMSLEEVRRLYFKIKNEVFTGGTYGFDTPTLERLLQDTFPPHLTMDCPTSHSTNVLISAVYKKTAPPQLHFFNNCFNDEFSKQPVWKVARYTTAAPMFFKECDDYVDGGVLANNPSETGLTAIQNFHHSKGSVPISLVVSVGTGIYPAEELGRIDVQDFLFFGKQWLNFQDTVRKRAKNLIQLLSNALLESETVAENTRARCGGQGTPFYRFSPKLAETVATGETDNGILINMIIAAIVQTVPHMELLGNQFQRIAEANQKERFRMRKSNSAAKVTSV